MRTLGRAGAVVALTAVMTNGVGLFFAVTLLAQNPPDPAVPASTTDLRAVAEQGERLKIQFEYFEKRAAQLQVLIGLILAVNTAYAIVLAGGTYLNLKPLLENARRESDDLRRFSENSRKELVEFRNEIRADLPTLQNMDKALRTILVEIRSRLPTDKDWRNPAYFTALPVREREQIQYAERTVAGFRFFELGKVTSFRGVVSDIYRGLGQFYGSQFAGTLGETWLFERALLYLEEACSSDPDSAAPHKDIGVLHTVAGTGPDRRDLSRKAFEQSLQRDSGEPGALFGMGWIEHMDKRWDHAVRYFTAMIDKRDWIDADRRKYLPDAYLNRGCSTAKWLGPSAPDGDYEKVFEDCAKGLESSRMMRVAEFRSRLERELEPAGDLEILSTRFPAKVQALLA